MRAVLVTDHQVRFDAEYSAHSRNDCVEVDVIQAGVCETDLQLIRGYMGFEGVLGHEFIGIARSGQFAGERVVGEINCACRTCPTCEAGLPTHCPNRTVIGILNHDGAFADTVWVPEENLHAVPDSVDDDNAVFTEPIAAAFQIPFQLDLSGFQSPVVLGDGRLGNLCAQVIAAHGKSPLVVGKHVQKLERLKKLGIATQLLDDVEEKRIADLVVDCTGSPFGLLTAFQICVPRGTIVMKSTFAGETGPNLAPHVIDEFTMVGSRCGPFAQAIDALARMQISVSDLITARYALEDSITALETAQKKDQLKVILDVQN
ncbi:2-deoxy-scyllo-inosamine dehydrogenase [Thalassoglobus neptunius]|uniref:2-deoxy-scyllo-inosamine dehydrogenase n=1 Tax=Thalassoglobus neptunius TaxID=1938619 RepID=A0A5C5X7G3_9PLAN|nr:alcohol dehydrogenase catalytic domain-containing protein [Thalassoglobus neptunius]TWT58203.1 2-deoxy-scyllo-inosamine dehydrogenase [Thalassoglobus neptunius]